MRALNQVLFLSLLVQSSALALSAPPEASHPVLRPSAPETYPAVEAHGSTPLLTTPQTPVGAGAASDLDSDSNRATVLSKPSAPLAGVAYEVLTPERSADIARKLKLVQEILSRYHRLYDAREAKVSDLYRVLAQLEGEPSSESPTTTGQQVTSSSSPEKN